MKFLLNMNEPRHLGRRLTKEGHEYRHMADTGMAEAGDAPILMELRANQEMRLLNGFLLIPEVIHGVPFVDGIQAPKAAA